jgi:uncharacterized glyoxalase superfamily protein PhnB
MGVEERAASEVGSVGIEIVILVPDVDAAYRRLADLGHRFDAPPADMPWGARHACL